MDYIQHQTKFKQSDYLTIFVQTSKINHMIKTREKKKNVFQVAVFGQVFRKKLLYKLCHTNQILICIQLGHF